MKELLIRANTWAYYHKAKAILLFIPLTVVALVGSSVISRALPPIGNVVFGIVTVIIAIAFVVYCVKQGDALDARKTKD